jgi:anti-sigma B factor antagonist
MDDFDVKADADGVLWLSGELDMAVSDRLVATATSNVDGHERVVLDLTGVTFLDSSGIRAILEISRTTARPVILRNPALNVRRVLMLAGIDDRDGIKIEV